MTRFRLPHRAATVATVIASLFGGGLFNRWFEHQPAAQSPAIPGLRRGMQAVLELCVVAPDGEVWRPTLRNTADAQHLAHLDVLGRRLDFTLARSVPECLRIRAEAAADGKLAAFVGEAEEGTAILWRLPLARGVATIKGELRREFGA